MSIFRSITKPIIRSISRSITDNPYGNKGLLTANAVGIWPMDDGSGVIARNIVGGIPDNNLWHVPEVGFTHQTSSSGGASSTDAYAVTPDGRMRAVRINFSGNGSKYLNNFACTSGVPHTLSFKYKRTGASNQTFRAYADTASGDLIATDTWQTHIQTWTPATATPTIGFAYTSAFDILISDFKVEQGLSATPYIAPQSHIIFQGNNKPTWSTAGIVTSSANRAAYATRNIDATLSTFTVYHAFKQSGSVNANYNTLQHLDITVNKWFMGPGPTANNVHDFSVLNQRHQAYGTKAADTNWHVIACVYDGAYVNYYLDGILTRTATTTGTITASYLRFFSLFTGGFGATGTHGYVAWYDTAHSSKIVVDSSEFIRKTIVDRGEVFSAYDNVVVFEGDSIFEGIAYAGLSPVPERVIPDMPANTFVSNTAKSGSSINSSGAPGTYNTSIYLRRTAIDNALLYPANNHILCVAAGTNDMNSGDSTTFLTNLKNYCQARKNAGWKVIVGTCLPSSYASGTFNSKRAVANAEIKNLANIGIYWDAVADQGGDATYAKDGDELNAAYYPDTVHPNNTVCAGIKQYWSDAINLLV